MVAGLQHGSQTIFVGDVDLAIGEHWRRAIDRRLDPLSAPDLLTRPGIQTPEDAAIVDRVEVLPVGDRRRHVGTVVELPELVRLRDVSLASRSEEHTSELQSTS